MILNPPPDHPVLQGADGIAFVFRSGPNAPKNASSGQPDILFYGGSPPAEGLFSIHFDTYQNVPVWNEPGSDFVAVYRDQNNVFDSRLCSRVQSTPPAVPFKGAPFNIRISTLGPGLLTPGSTNNVPDPSKQSRLRVSFWNQGDSEPTIPLMECGIDLGDIFKQSSLGTDGRQVWVGVTSLTGESANRHLITTASIKCAFAQFVMATNCCFVDQWFD